MPCFLSRAMSAQNQFENLMNQYSTEAAAEFEARERAERRRKLFKQLTKTFILLLLLAAAGAAWVYRTDLNKSLSRLKMKSVAEAQADTKAKNQAKAEAMAGNVQKLGTKRVDEFEATLK